ncbi:MAG: DNA polymerase III subunit delta [Proteobacteria bacterium]|jgi:DNA polymerase III subunit delta|nr:DNA polymerase III subunit delta [Pseudomonadota bacterium]
MSIEKLEKALRGETVPIYMLMGDAPLLVERAVSMVVEAVLPRCGLTAFNHSTFRGSDAVVLKAVAAARTLPMMADLRLVVLLEVESANERELEALLEYAKAPSSTSVLIVAGSKFKPIKKGQTNWGIRIQNAVKKKGLLFKLDNSSVSTVSFVQRQAKSLGKKLDRLDAELLVELVGTDLAVLSQEVEKLALFVGDEVSISSADIHRACSLLAEVVIWDLTSGLAARDLELSLESLHRLIAEGNHPRMVLGSIAWRMRTLLQVSELIQKGASDDVIRKVAKMRWDLFRRVRQLLGQQSLQADVVMKSLARANRAMNSHRAGDRRILEALVIELCQGPVYG